MKKTININDIIIRPIVTEKSTKLLDKNVYTLQVAKAADKLEIKQAIEFIFSASNAKVEKIRIQNIKKKAAKKGKFEGYKSSYKKAFIYLASGSIPIYGAQGVEDATKPKKKGLKIINTEKIMKQAEEKANK